MMLQKSFMLIPTIWKSYSICCQIWNNFLSLKALNYSDVSLDLMKMSHLYNVPSLFRTCEKFLAETLVTNTDKWIMDVEKWVQIANTYDLSATHASWQHVFSCEGLKFQAVFTPSFHFHSESVVYITKYLSSILLSVVPKNWRKSCLPWGLKSLSL